MAAQWLDFFAERKPAHDIIQKTIDLLQAENNLSEVLNLCHAHLQSHPRDIDALYVKAIALRGKRDFGDSLIAFEEIFGQGADHPCLDSEFETTLFAAISYAYGASSRGEIHDIFMRLFSEKSRLKDYIKDHLIKCLIYLFMDDQEALICEATCWQTTIASQTHSELQNRIHFTIKMLQNGNIGRMTISGIKTFIRAITKSLSKIFSSVSTEKQSVLIDLIFALGAKHSEGHFDIDIYALSRDQIINFFGFDAQQALASARRQTPAFERAKLHHKMLAVLSSKISPADGNIGSDIVEQFQKTDAETQAAFSSFRGQVAAHLKYSGLHQASDLARQLLPMAKAEIAVSDYDPNDYYLEPDWTMAFGHIALMELREVGAKAGLALPLPKLVFLPDYVCPNPALPELLMCNGYDVKAQRHAISVDKKALSMAEYGRLAKIHTNASRQTVSSLQSQVQRVTVDGVIKIPDQWEKRGTAYLQALGVDETSTVIVLHCRDGNFCVNLHSANESSRNVTLESYLPTIEYFLNKENHYVIRLGDKNMVPISLRHERLIDCTSLGKEHAYLSYYLLKRADYFIGTNSGPAAVAQMFKTRCFLTNWFPLGVEIHDFYGCISVYPKTISKGGRLVSLSDMMSEPLAGNHHPESIVAGADYSMNENTPDEILDAVIHDYEGRDTISEPRLRDIAQQIWNRHHSEYMPIADSFLRKYSALIE